MGYYLQMDGVDDRILLPSMTMTEIEIDFSFKPKATGQQRFWSFPFGASYFMRNNTFDEFHASTHSDFKVNGVSVTNSTAFIPANERVVARSILKSAMTQQTHIFNSNGNTAFVEGNIYRIKVFNGSTLMADYDLSTGDVQDKSGNGRHATLFGGTWVQDATTEPIPTPIQSDYTLKQVVYKQTTDNYNSKQIVSIQRSADNQTKQSIYRSLSDAFLSKQVIYKSYSDGQATKQIVFKQVEDDFLTTQVITALNGIISDFATKQIIYKKTTQDAQVGARVYVKTTKDSQVIPSIYKKQTQDVQINIEVFTNVKAEFPTIQHFNIIESSHVDVIEMIVSIKREINTNAKITTGGDFIANI